MSEVSIIESNDKLVEKQNNPQSRIDKNSIDAAIDVLGEQIEAHRSSIRRLMLVVIYMGVLLLATGVGIYIYQANTHTKLMATMPTKMQNNFVPFGEPTKPVETENARAPKQVVVEEPNQDVTDGGGMIASNGLVGMPFNVPSGGTFGGMSNVTTYTNEGPDGKIIFVFAALFTVVFGVLMAIYRFHLSEISRSEQYRFGLHRIRIAANNFDTTGFKDEVRTSLTESAFDFFSGKEKKVESPLPGHPASDLASIFANKLMEGIDVKVSPKP